MAKDIAEEYAHVIRSAKYHSPAGNFISFTILPDGGVTVCEELYWHPAFIIGNVAQDSVHTMWTSEKAMNLYKIAPDAFRDESVCRNCDDFLSCRPHQGVCWKEILNAYGYENWDYPDPKCPMAPEPGEDFRLI